MLQSLKDYATQIVHKKANEMAKIADMYMKERFNKVFNLEGDSMARCWNGNEDIKKITLDARTASLKMLYVLTAIRLDEGPCDIGNSIRLTDQSIVDSSSHDGGKGDSGNPLASSVWDEVSHSNTLITQEQCKSLWIEFLHATKHTISQATVAQENAATVRCDEIVNKKYSDFCAHESWLALKAAANSGPLSNFGKQLSSILQTHLSEYDKMAMYFNEDIRDAKRKQLVSKILQLAHPTYENLLGHLLSQATKTFQTQMMEASDRGEGFTAFANECKMSCIHEFAKQCIEATLMEAVDWNASNVREKLRLDLESHSSSRDLESHSSPRPSYKLYARALDITWGSTPQYWTYFHEQILDTESTVEVAKLQTVCWLEVKGSYDLRKLIVGTEYEIFFDIELTADARGWNIPVNFELNSPFGATNKFKRSLSSLIGQGPVEISIGKLELPDILTGTSDVTFRMHELGGHWKNGLVLRGILIKPV